MKHLMNGRGTEHETPRTKVVPPLAMKAIARRAVRRGFTLIELMVALAAGIAVAGAAYILSQASLDVFRQEERMGAAQSSATLGMSRLLTDLQRAGFMVSPNINADTAKQCGSTAAYTRLLAVQVFTGGSPVTPAATWNNLTPDRIRIAGNMSTSEQFDFRQLDGTTVFMAMDRGAMQRTLQATDNGGPSLRDIFKPARWVRIVDSTGHENYRRILSISCTSTSGGTACITADLLSMTITLDAPVTTTDVCGPGGTRGLINPVSVIEYSVGVPATGVGATVDAVNSVAPVKILSTGDDTRTELLRTEVVDTGGPAMPAMPADALNPFDVPATDVVSEYAVDLAFGATIRTGAVNTGNPTLSRLDFQAPAIAATPSQKFVSLTVRLTTRTRAPDRPTSAPNAPLSRYAVFKAPLVGPPGGPVLAFTGGTASTNLYFARTRSLTTEVNLPNLAGADW